MNTLLFWIITLGRLALIKKMPTAIYYVNDLQKIK